MYNRQLLCSCLIPHRSYHPDTCTFWQAIFAHIGLNYFTGERKELEMRMLKTPGKGNTRSQLQLFFSGTLQEFFQVWWFREITLMYNIIFLKLPCSKTTCLKDLNTKKSHIKLGLWRLSGRWNLVGIPPQVLTAPYSLKHLTFIYFGCQLCPLHSKFLDDTD